MPLNLFRYAWYWISGTPTYLPVLLLPLFTLIAFRAWLSGSQSRPAARWAATAAVAFAILDWSLLALLPHFNLSFGPVGLPLLSITFFRLVFSILLVRSWQWVGKYRPQFASIRALSAAVALLWLVNLGMAACEIYGLYFEPFNLDTTIVTVDAPDLPVNSLRIVQISDLHVERITKREREIVDRVRELEPDLIVLTGDYLSTSNHNDHIAWQDVNWFFSQLEAPFGIYAIMAKPGDSNQAMAEMTGGLDITVLHDEVRRVEIDNNEIYLLGITNLYPERDNQVLPRLAGQTPEDAFTLLLYHTPDMIEVAAEEKIDLYLSGHTHGGQICLPLFGAVITASKYWKKYEHGLYTIDQTTLYVSGGIGMEGQGAPRARFFCPPEIVVVDLVR
ncbi:MAG: metallophosphoesterase [Anaerolineales bacterium]|nr:metallophosphoesterase [Anaerolineales bacterium]